MTSLSLEDIKSRYNTIDESIAKYFRNHRVIKQAQKTWLLKRNLALKFATEAARKEKGANISFSYSAEPWQVIYGRVRVAGTLIYMATLNNNNDLDLIHVLAGHQIAGIDEFWLDDEQVILNTVPDLRWSHHLLNLKRKLPGKDDSVRNIPYKVFLALNDGNPSNAVQGDVSARHAEWDSRHTCSGRAHAFTILKWDPIAFPSGSAPAHSFVVRGKLIYDPRTSTTGYSNNAALVIADFLTDPVIGLGIPWTDIETRSGIPGSFHDAADVCEEAVSLAAGGTEPRYTINAAFQTSATPSTIMQSMADAIAGFITFANGKWKCYPGKWRTPTLTIDEQIILTPISIEAMISRRESCNGVKGTFISPTKYWQEDEYPAIKNDYYKSLDGNERIWQELSLGFVTSATQAQRIAKILLERARQQIQVSFTATLAAYQLEVGENVLLSNTRMGWSSKPFEVQSMEITSNGGSSASAGFISCDVTLRETASTLFDWNNGEETTYDLSPNTSLPNPFSVDAITGLTLTSGTTELYITKDGTVVSRIKAVWDTETDAFVSSGGAIEISWKKTTDLVWCAPISIPGNNTYYWILDVQDGAYYDVRVQPVSALRVRGDYTTITGHLCLGKSDPPDNVSGLGASMSAYGITLAWGLVSNLDADHYEVKCGTVGDNWESAQFVAAVTGTRLDSPLRAEGTYRFFVKCVDTSGNYSTEAATADLVILGPPQVAPTFQIIGTDIVLSWPAVTSAVAITEYVMSYGASYPGTSIGTITGTTWREQVTWSGTRSYWVAARDAAGNLGTAGKVDVAITAPGAIQSYTSEAFDNNALLKWQKPTTGLLPIDYYKVLKGSTYAGAVEVGRVSGTFAAFFESTGGNYTYWVVPVDTAGNLGTESGRSVLINQPPDYVLQDLRTLDPAAFDTLTNGAVDSGGIYAPVSTSQTWQTHFTGNSWSTPQDQITAGYPQYIQPSTTPATLEEKIDYGATLPGTVVSVQWLAVQLAGTCTVQCDIGSSTDDVTYTYDNNVTQIYKSAFRYLKIRLTVTASSGAGIVRLSNIQVRLDVKQKNDGGGPVTAASADTTKSSTISIASPAVITSTAHGFLEGQVIQFTTSGALPTGLSTLTDYVVRNPAANTFNVSTVPVGSLINTSGSQSGSHNAVSPTHAYFSVAYLDVNGLNVTLTPTAAQLSGASLPWTAITGLLDQPYPKGFAVRVYDRNGNRVASDFRWTARGI
jgi:hypothetical protein